MSQLKTNFEEQVKAFTEEHAKFTEKGNKAAGTRARKALQEITVLAKALRKEISEEKNS